MSAAPEDSAEEAAEAVERLMALARQGSPEALGQVLESCRQYLLLVAQEELDLDLRNKVSPSDLVQDAFLEAQRDFHQFRGDQEAELIAWLRRILLHTVTDTYRRYLVAEKRDVSRELSLDQVPIHEFEAGLDKEHSPRAQMIARENVSRVRQALQGLPESDQQLITWRNYDLCTFAEIGRRLGKTEEAARKAWIRAVEQLERLLGSPSDSQ